MKSLGDGLMMVFASAADALQAATQMQRRIGDSDLGVSIRIGINNGEPIAAGDDYQGTPVVTAQRLCDLASGGQVLVSGGDAGPGGQQGR